MNPARLDTMPQNAVALDLETHLIQPGLMAPPIVCGSGATLLEAGVEGGILTSGQARQFFDRIIDSTSAVLCGANIAYDLLVLAVDYARRGLDVMPQIFAMYDPANEVTRGRCDGRVFEIQLAEGLHAIAQGHLGKHAVGGQQIVNPETKRPGRYSLQAVTHEVLGRDDAKVNDRFRLSYALLEGTPIEQWPFEARTYPIDDAVNTLEVALAQAGHAPSCAAHRWTATGSCARCGQQPGGDSTCRAIERRRNLHALSLQAYFAWAAHIGSAWGLHVPQDEVDKLEAKVDAEREASIGPFVAAGIIRENGTEDQSVLKKLVAVAYGARDVCAICAGTRKVPSPATNGRSKINCGTCDGTGLALPPEVPRSEGGGVGKSRDVLAESGDELLMDYAEQPSRKIKTTYIPLLRRARACTACGRTGLATKYTKAHEEWCPVTTVGAAPTYRPIPLIVRVDPLKETLRASIEDGLHSMPRRGGIRECFVARPGYVYSSEDYKAGELVTLSDACMRLLGWSKLGEALNAGLDPHLALAAQFCSKPYEVMQAAKKAKEPWLDPQRQVAKKSNFGFGGGMAELEFVLRPCRADPDSFTPCANGPSERHGVRGYTGTRPCIMMDGRDHCGGPGEKILVYNDRPTGSPVCMWCLAAGKRAREMWFATWAEMREFFKIVKRQITSLGPSGTPEIDYPELITRGGLGFCDGANGYFQMSLAKAAKVAFCQVQRECLDKSIRVRSSEMMQSRFDGAESPLLGSRAILLFHDEIVAEHPESIAAEAAIRVSEVMVEALRLKCPSMQKAVEAEPCLMRRLYKGAEATFDQSGRLVPWEPHKKAA